MPQPKQPVAGYPSKGEAIKALWNQGLDAAEIARRCETSKGTVFARVQQMRREGETVIMRPRGGKRRGAVPPPWGHCHAGHPRHLDHGEATEGAAAVRQNDALHRRGA